MQGSVKSYIEKIERFGKDKNEKIKLLLIGGLAMSFYGNPRFTVDINAEIHCSEKIYFEFFEYLRKEKTAFNIGEDINKWGIISLPDGYRKRAKICYESEYLILKVLEPLDFVFSKLLRGTQQDFHDIMKVIKRYKITRKNLQERERLIRFPKDPETLFFKKKFSHLMGLLK